MLRFLVSIVLNIVTTLRFGVRSVLSRLARPGPQALWLRVSGDLAYLVPPQRLPWLFRYVQKAQGRHLDEASSLRTLTRDLAVLAAKRHIRALVVHVEGVGGSGSSLSVLTEAIQSFRTANKPVWGYARMATTGEYRFLAGLDRVFLAPGGHLELAGYQAEVLSLHKTLAMVGVRPQFLRRGEFKTAPEMFTRDRISPAQEQTIATLLDERMENVTQAIAAGRHQTVEDARAAIDKGPYSSRRAVEAHLADAVADPAGIEDELKAQIGKDLEVVSYGEVEGIERRSKPRYRPLRQPPFAAVVPIHGIISVGDGRSSPMGAVAGSDSVVASLKRAVESKKAKAILLHIESRGGSATASELIHAAVQRAAKEKPVLCYVDGIAASGGYMAAVGAKEIWCAKEAIVGSIGVFGGKFDVEGLLAFLQVGVDSVQRGAHAGLNSLFRPWSEGDLAVLDAQIEETYRDFVRIVAEGRHLSEDVVHSLGEGRIFTGPRAQQHQLVDGLCGFGDAIAKTCALGGLPADAPLGWIDSAPRSVSPLQLLRGAARERMWAVWTGSMPA